MASERLVGVHVVREALRAGRRKLHAVHLQEGDRPALAELEALAEAAGLPVVREPLAALDRGLPSGVRSQGAMLEAGPLPEVHLEELAGVGRVGARRLVVLDGVQDPQNLGAVARVAEASGAMGLVLARRHAPPLGAAVSRASAGAIEHLPVARVPNIPRALRILKGAGFWVFGADSEAGEDLFELDEGRWRGDLALVLGAEGRGLRPGVLSELDHRVRIPMHGRVGSLNVATAAAVLLYEAARRQHRG